MKKEFKRTWLLQRLQTSRGQDYNNPFLFGGGLKNGGLAEDAYKMLNGCFSFDYMGAAEYEFGAIPETLQQIAKDIKDYSTCEILINKMPVYVVFNNNFKEETVERVKELSKGTTQTKGYNDFNSALGLNKYSPKEKCRTIGWMELDNGFFFFTEKQAFDRLCTLFGLKSENQPQ